MLSIKDMEFFNSSLRYSNHRDFMPVVVEQLCIRTMVEVGVLHGALSTAILANCSQIENYYLVDAWQPFTSQSSDTQEIWDKRYSDVRSKMKQYADKARIIKLTSIEAVALFEPESVDLVYIDANHSFEHVDEDIKAWWPKIRPTGYLAGHDMSERWPGVLKAVEANVGDQYFCGQPTDNWNWVWIISKSEIKKRIA